MTTATTALTPSSRFDGRVISPGDAEYDEARSVWNAMVDHRPRMIVRCANVADVIAAVRIARERDLEIGVRCGGHNLRPMGAVHVDPERRRAFVQGGALLGALDRAAQRYGLATTAGNVSHTGAGGLTLGGGMGWLARRFGLACDNVVAYTIVTANGEVLRVSADEHPDLFWGLRGGGGNFGIVTEFEFRLHPIGTRTLVADLWFPIADARSALAGWRELAVQAPREATFTAAVVRDRVRVGYVWVGDPAQGRRLLPALRALGRPAAEQISEPSYVALQSREDSVQGHAVRRYWKGHYLPGLPDAAIDAMLHGGEFGSEPPTASLQTYGGAIADVPDADTAFSHRHTQFEYVGATSWTDAASDCARMELVRRCAERIAPYANGAYVNTLNDEGAAGVQRAYTTAKLMRLTAVKDTYDPDNVFHLNHNIAPSGR
jgi:FAD/FMN-containing dehydrogenase